MDEETKKRNGMREKEKQWRIWKHSIHQNVGKSKDSSVRHQCVFLDESGWWLILSQDELEFSGN